MGHSCVEIYIHVIFSTKNRLPLIPENLENRLWGYISGVAAQNRIRVLQINGMTDHIHILLKLHPTIAISKLLQELKAYSSGWMKKQGIEDFGWQEGYGAFSCSINHVDALKKYIANQKEHHKTHTFEEEVANLNRIWNCNFSPQTQPTQNELQST